MAELDLRGLFGPEVNDNDKRKANFNRASAEWAKLYQAAERRPYRWRGRCNRHIADILAEVGSVERFAAAAAVYLADKWHGYDGHELRHLARDITRFVARAERLKPNNDARRVPGNDRIPTL